MYFANQSLTSKILDTIVKAVRGSYAIKIQLANGCLNQLKVKKERDLCADVMTVLTQLERVKKN